MVASGAKMFKDANPTLFAELVEAVELDQGQGMTISSEIGDQIAKDLPRTLPNNVFFRGGHQVSQASVSIKYSVLQALMFQ